MQISYSVFSSQYNSKISKPSATAGTASYQASSLSDEQLSSLSNYGDSSNTIFQNLLKDESVQRDVTLNVDGTYSFHFDPSDGPINQHQDIAKLLIWQQNGYNSTVYPGPGAMEPYSTHDLELFRQLTGYNLLQAGGGYTVVDDYGNPPAPGDQAMCTAAWDMFDNIHMAKTNSQNDDSDITLDDLKMAVEGASDNEGANHEMFDELLKMIDAMALEHNENALSMDPSVQPPEQAEKADQSNSLTAFSELSGSAEGA